MAAVAVCRGPASALLICSGLEGVGDLLRLGLTGAAAAGEVDRERNGVVGGLSVAARRVGTEAVKSSTGDVLWFLSRMKPEKRLITPCAPRDKSATARAAIVVPCCLLKGNSKIGEERTDACSAVPAQRIFANR